MVSQPRVTNYDFVFGLQLKRKAAAVVVDRLDYLAADLDVCMTVCMCVSFKLRSARINL